MTTDIDTTKIALAVDQQQACSGLAECSAWPSIHRFSVEVQWPGQWRWELETRWETQSEADQRAARVLGPGYGFQAARSVAVSAHETSIHGSPMSCPNDERTHGARKEGE
jgi:hypothetical protein